MSILIGQTQVALARERSAKRLRETLESNLEAFERRRIIVNDMLFLARRDRGERATDLADVSLAAELTRMLAFLEMSLDDAQLRAELTGDARASVDPSLFGRAMTNLLINAIQHTRAENTIRATSTPRGETVEIAVSHPGEPIDAAARASVRARLPDRAGAREQRRESRARPVDREGSRRDARRRRVRVVRGRLERDRLIGRRATGRHGPARARPAAGVEDDLSGGASLHRCAGASAHQCIGGS
ncbi:ATPase [Burkholderia pseudomallei]|uniref:ATPase n=2 Tax=Burkholderia pseudomallei TaxID=28450 RepID=UPI000055B2D1|nr:ATPase [Burkholderia pseudomallei]